MDECSVCPKLPARNAEIAICMSAGEKVFVYNFNNTDEIYFYLKDACDLTDWWKQETLILIIVSIILNLIHLR
jgi:hypothetical protein